MLSRLEYNVPEAMAVVSGLPLLLAVLVVACGGETATVDVTASPEVTPSSEADDREDVAELAWLDDAGDWMTDAQAAVDGIAALTGGYTQLNEDRALAIKLDADILQERIHEMNVPPVFAEVHGWLIKEGDSLQAGAEAFWLGNRDQDVYLIDQSASDLQDALDHFQRAVAAMDNWPAS